MMAGQWHPVSEHSRQPSQVLPPQRPSGDGHATEAAALVLSQRLVLTDHAGGSCVLITRLVSLCLRSPKLQHSIMKRRRSCEAGSRVGYSLKSFGDKEKAEWHRRGHCTELLPYHLPTFKEVGSNHPILQRRTWK